MLSNDPAALAAARVIAKQSLKYFTQYMFKARKGYAWRNNWHHDEICKALERVYRGECKRLIINIPPRYSKTEIAVVNFIAWCFAQAPDCEFIHASYSATLAGNNLSNVRDLVTHESYQELFPEVGIDRSSSAKAHWKTTAGGVAYASGTKGTITGFGAGKMRDGFGGAVIIDDAHKADVLRQLAAELPTMFTTTQQAQPPALTPAT